MVATRKVFKTVSGTEAVEIIVKCLIYGFWQLIKIGFVRLWKGHRRKSSDLVELTEDSSIGTHYYVKIMGVKYHYVECGPKFGQVVLSLCDAPDPGFFTTTSWYRTLKRLNEAEYRVVTLDLRGTGGSEGGSRVDLSPPRVVEEMQTLLQALGVTEQNKAVVFGHGVGGMVAWYLAHSSSQLIDQLVVLDAPHPSLYWQFPPAEFCKNALHFIQWPYLPEQWLAEGEMSNDSENTRWANSRACDWSGALNYIRGAAWWHIKGEKRVVPRCLLIGNGQSAAQLVASAERCSAPTLRLVSTEQDIAAVLMDYFIVKDLSTEKEVQWRGGLMGRVFGAVAGRGRELSARLLLPPTPA